MLKAIIFDFDGVLVESVDVKTEAFRELFKDFPDKTEEIIRFHITNGGMSRFDKFNYIYEHIIKKPLPADLFDKLCDDFSRLVVDKVVGSPLVNGAEEFLSKNMKRYDIYVVSATPDAELKIIIERRGMTRYFRGMFGSPKSKEEILNRIIRDYNYSLDEVIFIGDSINDYRAAAKAGVRFATRVSNQHDSLIPSQVKVRFNDLFGLARYLKESKL